MRSGTPAGPPDEYELMSFFGTLGENVDDDETISRYVVTRNDDTLSLEIHFEDLTAEVLWTQVDDIKIERRGRFLDVHVDAHTSPHELIVSFVEGREVDELRFRIEPYISMYSASMVLEPAPTPEPAPIAVLDPVPRTEPIPQTSPDVMQQVLALENEFIFEGAETEKDAFQLLEAAYQVLLSAWNTGDRDREVGLHLLFLSWHQCAVADSAQELQGISRHDPGVFARVRAELASSTPDDELIFITEMMAAANPRCCGLTIFEIEMLEPTMPDIPVTIQRETFEGRGYYGWWFTHFAFGDEPEQPSPMIGGGIAGYAHAIGDVLAMIAQNLRF